NNWGAEAFRPVLATGISSYSITRVRLYLSADANPDGRMKVQVRTADALFKPTSTVLDETIVLELAASLTGNWVDVNFTKLTNLHPLQNYCFVIAGYQGTGFLGTVNYVNLLAPTNVNGWSCSNGAGGSPTWSGPVLTSCMRF